jgi:hypothetical protein
VPLLVTLCLLSDSDSAHFGAKTGFQAFSRCLAHGHWGAGNLWKFFNPLRTEYCGGISFRIFVDSVRLVFVKNVVLQASVNGILH